MDLPLSLSLCRFSTIGALPIDTPAQYVSETRVTCAAPAYGADVADVTVCLPPPPTPPPPLSY